MEEGLRAGGVIAAVVGEIGALPTVGSRRLQLAAERSGVTALILRRWHNATEAARERNRPNAAATRWRIAARPSAPISMPSPAPTPTLSRLRGRAREGAGWGAWVGQPRWRVELIRCRGGEPACWEVEIDNGKISDAAGSLSLAAALADRPAAPLPGFDKIRRAG
jgi:protein ImuA